MVVNVEPLTLWIVMSLSPVEIGEYVPLVTTMTSLVNVSSIAA